jgi:hypothetical protein
MYFGIFASQMDHQSLECFLCRLLRLKAEVFQEDASPLASRQAQVAFRSA